MVCVHEDGILVSGEHSVCDEVFDQLKQQRFPMKNSRQVKIDLHWLLSEA